VAGLAGVVVVGAQVNALNRSGFADPPAILAAKARDLAGRLGYGSVADSAYGLATSGVAGYARANLSSDMYDALVRNSRTSPVTFWYRHSPREMATLDTTAPVSLGDPPPVFSGMVSVVLDPEGRLLSFTAVPPQEIGQGQSSPIDWTPLFDAAGLDQAQWTPTDPQRTPLAAFDVQAAWTGSVAHAPSVPMSIDAAAWRGRPVLFAVRSPWVLPTRDAPAPRTTRQRVGAIVSLAVQTLLLVFAAVVALRHYRTGRGDLHGASRLAGFVFVVALISRMMLAHHVADSSEFGRVFDGLGEALGASVLVGGLYLALEPYVRRRWPQSLISWTRLLGGGWNHRAVAGHVLAGVLLGVGLAYAAALAIFLGGAMSGAGSGSRTFALGPARAIGTLAGILGAGAGNALLIFFLFFILRVVLRSTWLAAALVIVLGAIITGSSAYSSPWAAAILGALRFGGAVAILTKHGVLPMVVAVAVNATLAAMPQTTDLSAWYAAPMLTVLGLIMMLSLWSFRAALAGRRAWNGDLLEG
jgi:serine/threonine-protein kinase